MLDPLISGDARRDEVPAVDPAAGATARTAPPAGAEDGRIITAIAAAVSDDYPELRGHLDEIHRGMGADTATVLLLDRTRTVLEPAATIGLDPTLHGARRVPIGQGFAGRVAQTRQPVFIGEVTSDQVINPVLLAHGVRSLLGVPLTDGSELLGVLHVGFLTSHQFGDAEKHRLTQYAHSLGELLRDRFNDAEHTAALTLQRSLLPTAPLAPPGIAIAARYVPAEGDLGGDWYDVFELPDGRLGLVMGDVVGHGLEAAIVMGRLRSALRAYALEHDSPAEVLHRLDRKICHFEPNALATVLFGLAAPPYEEWQFSCAGHFPPMVATADQPAEPIRMKQDPLLGLAPDAIRHTTTVSLPVNGLLCLFTDGLIERRPTADRTDHDVVAENLGRLAEALAGAEDPEMGCIRALTQVVGQHLAEDDIALLVAQRTS